MPVNKSIPFFKVLKGWPQRRELLFN